MGGVASTDRFDCFGLGLPSWGCSRDSCPMAARFSSSVEMRYVDGTTVFVVNVKRQEEAAKVMTRKT